MPLTTLKGVALLLIGALCGFISSSPPGPINLIVADSVVGERKLHRTSFLAGVIVAELILAGIAFWGFQSLLQGPLFQQWAPIVGGAFVIGLGVAGLFSYQGKKKEGIEKEGHSHRQKGGDLLQGLFLCGSNPAFLLFWIYIMSALSYSGVSEGVPLKSLYLLLGISLGNMIWFILFITLLRKGAGWVEGKHFRLFRKGVSMALILLGLGGILISFGL